MRKRKGKKRKSRSSYLNHSLRLPVDDLRWRWSSKDIAASSTDDIDHTTDIIGQERALKAIRTGLEMKHPGYNIFVSGLTGTGRTTTIKRLLREFEKDVSQLEDLCYVYNFHDRDRPMLIRLPTGKGRQFEKDMETFVNDLRKSIPTLLESKQFQEKRKNTVELFQNRQRTVLREFENKVKEKGFELVQVQVGTMVRPEIAPVIDNKPVGLEQIESMVKEGKLSEEAQKNYIESYNTLTSQMEAVFREMKNIERKAREALEKLDEQTILPIIKDYTDDIAAKYDNPKVNEYLDDVCQSVVENLNRFRREEQPQSQLPIPIPQPEADNFVEYKVNVIVDNAEQKKIPVIIETNPKYKNLFGTVERSIDSRGIWRTDFTQIKAGSILKANGGYLVLNALDTLIEPGVWQDLKRTLRTNLVDIQSYEPWFSFSSSGMKPEPIEIDIKVIMIGEAFLYYLLYDRDDDFKKIFKIRADFDVEMERNSNHIQNYCSFIKMVCNEENLLPFDKSAIGEVIEFGVRLAGRKKKLSTRFNVIADIIREASYWAQKENARKVTGSHINRAIEERVERVNLIESKIKEMIKEGTLLVDTDGEVVGQVNGLAVYDMGEHVFGKPTRITAKTSLGKGNILNIEREADLSGKVHRKGVAILTGYIHWMFSQDKPLGVTASICFEQSYSGVDGDSASSTEIYAILSSLSGVPIKQGIGVTGSVNQSGQIQPIGGVNVKIEGFFDVCKERGLTGDQGVIIPQQNIKDLMLRKDVIQAVEEKKFHIFAINTVEEGIEILTGVKAGKKLKTGKFEPNSIFGKVDAQLNEYAKRIRARAKKNGNTQG